MHDGPDDAALVAGVAAGDRASLALLHRRHAGWLTARLSRRCTDADLVDSALQDTFVAVWRGAGAYRGEGEVGAWLWGIAVRRLADQVRAQRRQGAPADPPPEPSAEEVALAASVDGPFRGPAWGDVGAAVRTLPLDQQRVLLAVVVDGLSTREAAALLGIPRNTVKTRLARARAHLRGRLP